MIYSSFYKSYLIIFSLSFSSNIFSQICCDDCCEDCCKKENKENIISLNKSFKYNFNASEYKENNDFNFQKEISSLDKNSNAFKYLKIAEAIDVYNDENNNKILRKNNLRNKIELCKTLPIRDGTLKDYVDNKGDNHNCEYGFAEVMNSFKESLENNKQLIPTKKFFKYFYHPEYLESNFKVEETPTSEYLLNNSENFGYIKLSMEESEKDDLRRYYNSYNNSLLYYFEGHYSSFNNFYKLKLHQIYKWLDDNRENANLDDPNNIYSFLDSIAKQRTGLCRNEAENIISSMYSAIISFINKNIKNDDIEIFTYSILSDFRQTIANGVVNTMISQPDENNYIKDESSASHIQENANVIRFFLNSFLNSNVSYTQVFSYLFFFDKAVEQANEFLKKFFNFDRFFEIILRYTEQARSNGSLNNFIEEIENIKVSYLDIYTISKILEVKNQIERRINAIDNKSSKKSFEERLDLYLEKNNNEDLRNWMKNKSLKPLKDLIEICKHDYDKDVIGNCDHYFYLPELTEFYFNNDPDNIINYFTYILFPLYLLKKGYIKIKS